MTGTVLEAVSTITRWEEDKKHRTRVDLQNLWRGCTGFALVLDPEADKIQVGHRTFVMGGEESTWVSILDLPPYKEFFPRFGKSRMNVDAAGVHEAGLFHGRPVIGLNNFLALQDRDPDRELLFDFRRKPYDTALRGGNVVVKAGSVGARHTLNVSLHPQLFEAFVRVSESMTSMAYSYRGPWRKHREDFFSSHEIEQGEKPLLKYGPDVKGRLAIHRSAQNGPTWMPRPYVAIQLQHLDQVVAVCCGKAGRSSGLQRAFVRDLSRGLPLVATKSVEARTYAKGPARLREQVGMSQWGAVPPRESRLAVEDGQPIRSGDILGLALPGAMLSKKSKQKYRWDTIVKTVFTNRRTGQSDRRGLEIQLRHWFLRQLVTMPDVPGVFFVQTDHLDYLEPDLIEEGSLFWRVDSCERYWNEGAEAYVFPPLRIRKWDQFRHQLPWGVYLNISPW